MNKVQRDNRTLVHDKDGQNIPRIMNNPRKIRENTEKYLPNPNLVLERELHGLERN